MSCIKIAGEAVWEAELFHVLFQHEVLRRVAAKAALHIMSMDILMTAGDSQLCAGHINGCEAGVHAMTGIQVDDQTEGVLLVDASNAFNSLNREAAMRNIYTDSLPTLSKDCDEHISQHRTSLH